MIRTDWWRTIGNVKNAGGIASRNLTARTPMRRDGICRTVERWLRRINRDELRG